MNRKHSRLRPARRALLFWTLFIGIGAVIGASAMLIDPSGRLLRMDALLPYFRKLPLADLLYRDYVFPGIALLLINGLPNLIAAGLLLAKRRTGIILGGVLGVTLMLWICIQFYLFPPNVLDTAYFLFGLMQAVTGYAAWVFWEQEHFTVRAADYPNAGTNPDRLVVYFSRMGYTKKLALEEANRTGACLCEIRAAERTAGTAGFWWCGRYGMHRWAMPIKPPAADPAAFRHVTICAPVWVFHLAAPLRTYCRMMRGKILDADYILVHHQKSACREAAAEMDCLLGLRGSPAVSVCCRRGHYLKKERLQ